MKHYLRKPEGIPGGRAASVRYEPDAPRLKEAKRQYRKHAPKHEDVINCVLDTIETLGIQSRYFAVNAEELITDEHGYCILNASSVLGDQIASSPIVNLTYAENAYGEMYPLCVALGISDLNQIYPLSIEDCRKTYNHINSYNGDTEEAWTVPTKGVIAFRLGLRFSKNIDLFPLIGIEHSILTAGQVEFCIGESVASRFALIDRWSHCYQIPLF